MSRERAELSEAADAFKAAFLQANEAFNRHDFRSAFAGLPADLEWHLPAEWQGLTDAPQPLRGPDAIRKAFENLLADFPDWHSEAREFIEAPGFILVRSVVTATGRASGVEARYDFTDVWEFKDGAPIRVRANGSHAEALEAAGLRE